MSGVSQGSSPTSQMRIAQFAFKSNISYSLYANEADTERPFKTFSKEERQITNRK